MARDFNEYDELLNSFDKNNSRDISSNSSGNVNRDTRPDFERTGFSMSDLKPEPVRSNSNNNDMYFSKQEPPTPRRRQNPNSPFYRDPEKDLPTPKKSLKQLEKEEDFDRRNILIHTDDIEMENILKAIESVNGEINSIVWGTFGLLLLVGTGIIVTILTKFFQVSHIGLWFKHTLGSLFNKDVIKHMTVSMKGLAGYIVLVFFAAQFIYWFNYSNLGLILAINGAEFLKSVGFTGLPLIICFILLSAFLNLFMGSASAKWAILAPVFIPMFMLLDFHPGLTQASFRVGDSVTNVITPMMSYFALIVTYAQRYDEKYGIGTIISLMIPYTLIFLLAWIVIITIWVIGGFPLGFDGPLYLS